MGNSPGRAGVDVGSVIADTYTIEGLIGRGGMGTVFLASHNRLPGKTVAIKLLHTDHEDKEIFARFWREALIASQLNHPNIVAVHDFNTLPDGAPYVVLEFLQGESLAERIDHGGALPLAQVFAILRQVGSAITAAHQHGIIHRDLKPQNIFLVPVETEGEVVEVAKVLDFGISKIRGSDTVKTQESTLLGTPQYMAPEQATGQHANVDERTDVFALGAIVYEMLAGKPAFSGASIPEVVFKVVYEPPPRLDELAPEVPAPVVTAIMKAMAKQSADRFASVSDFVEALTGTPIAARPSMSAIERGEAALASGSRIRPPSTGRGKLHVGRTSQSGRSASSSSGQDATLGVSATAAPATQGDALASTLDPAVQAKANLASAVTSRPPTVRNVSPRAPTVDSISPANRHEATQVPARKPPTLLYAGMAVAALAVIGVCIFLVVRGGAQQGTVVPEPLAGGALLVADASVVSDTIVATPADAALAVDAAPISDAGSVKPPPDATKKGTAAPTAPDAPLTEEEKLSKDRVQRAEAALARDTEESNAEAQRLSNAVIDADVKRFMQRALAVRGVLKCRSNLPLDARRILGQLRDPAARSTLRRGCKRAGTSL